MVDRVSPEEESPPLPAISPTLLSRQGTPTKISETVYGFSDVLFSQAASRPTLTMMQMYFFMESP
jgi:hypothetical protein